jgi:hypothetical protein
LGASETPRGNVHVVINDESWIPASDNVITSTIMSFGGINVFIGFTINIDPIYFYNPDFLGPIHSAFPEEEQAGQLGSAFLEPEFSEEKIGFPPAVFNGEANPDLEPEYIFSFEEGSSTDDYPKFAYSFGDDSEEQSITFPPS